MRRVIFVLCLVGVLLLPALSAAAKPLDASSSAQNAQVLSWLQEFWTKLPTFFNSSSSATSSLPAAAAPAVSWLDHINSWFKQTLGIDLYALAWKILSFIVVAVRVVIQVIWQGIMQARTFLLFH